jgi:prophage regulatory protein
MEKDALVTYAEIKSVTGRLYSRTHIARLIKEGKFPKPVPVNGRSIAWRKSDLTAWTAAKLAKDAA